MGIRLSTVHLLAQTFLPLDNLADKKLLTLGVQDCYFTYEQILAFLRRHKICHQPINAAEVLPTTGFKWASPAEAERYKYFDYIHQESFFSLLGFSPENIYAMDVSLFEGANIIHDLNVPVDDSLCSSFDVVIDCGTIEHVFSIKDALFNMCRMCKVGGIVVNMNPVDYLNHGFVNFNAELFRDSYLTNGFEEVSLNYIVLPTHPRQVDQYYLKYSPEKFHFPLRPYYAAQVYSAYRKVEEKPLIVPQQGYYRNLWASGPAVMLQQNRTLWSRLRRKTIDWIDAYFIPSVLARDFASLRLGEKVIL